MSRSLRTSTLWFLAVVIAGLWSGTSVSQAQNARPEVGGRQPAAPILKSYDFADMDVAAVLRTIANEGGLEIIIGDDVSGTVAKLKIVDLTPEQAIERVAEVAGLGWQRLDNGVYILHKKSRHFPLNKTQGFDFTASDIPYQKVFSQLAEFSGTKIFVVGPIPGTLKYIRLNKTTVEDAVDTIARAAGVSWHKTRTGEIIVMGQNPIVSQVVVRSAPTPSVPAPQPWPFVTPTPDTMPPGASPFNFNGMTVYHVPLDEGSTP